MDPVVRPRSHAWRPPPLLLATAALHGAALATAVAEPRLSNLMLATVVGNHAIVTAAGMFPRCRWLGPNITRLPFDDGVVSLTFDDGPHPEFTPAVLDLLDRAGARATFFCVGRRAEEHPDLVAAIRQRGHGVENHTYEHPNSFAFRGPAGLRREIERAQDAIEGAGGGRPRYFRAPAGIQNPFVPLVLARAGLSLVSWTRRGFDTVTHDGARVAARLQRGLRGGDILVLHDASSARGPSGRPSVLEALPRLLTELDRRKLRSEALHVALARPAGSSHPTRPGG